MSEPSKVELEKATDGGDNKTPKDGYEGNFSEILSAELPTRTYMSPLEICALGYNLCSSWVGIATSMSVAISSGGSFTLVYGILVVSFNFLCTGASLAELTSVYPSASGQYVFTYILARVIAP